MHSYVFYYNIRIILELFLIMFSEMGLHERYFVNKLLKIS